MAGGTDTNSIVDTAINGAAPSDPTAPIGSSAPDGSVAPLTSSVFDQLVKALGNPTRIETVNPTIKPPAGTFGAGLPGPNPSPTYRYWFSNGKYLDMISSSTGLVTKGGTALSVLSGTATPKGPTTVAQGGSHYIWNPTGGTSGTGAYEPAPGMPAGTPPAPGVTTRTVNGSLYQWDPNSGNWAPAQGVPAGQAKIPAGQRIKGDDGTIYTVGADGTTLTAAVQGQDLGATNAATAKQNADTATQAEADRAKTAQQNADTAATRATYQGQINQAKQDYLDGKLSLAEFTANVTELHQQATEALTARSQDLTAATTAARDQATADASWAQNSVPAGSNAALVGVLNKEGAPAGVNLPPPNVTPYPRPDINAMITSSLAKIGVTAPWNAPTPGAVPGVPAAAQPQMAAQAPVAAAPAASPPGLTIPPAAPVASSLTIPPAPLPAGQGPGPWPMPGSALSIPTGAPPPGNAPPVATPTVAWPGPGNPPWQPPPGAPVFGQQVAR